MQNSSITAYCIKMKQDMLYLMNFYAYQNAFTMDQQRLQILNQFKTNIKIANLTVLLRKMKERSLFFGKSNMFLIVLGLLIIASYCGYSRAKVRFPQAKPHGFAGKYIRPDYVEFYRPKQVKNFGPKFGDAGHFNKPAKYLEKQPSNHQYQKPSSLRNSFDATFEAQNQNNVDIRNTFNPKIDMPINNNVGTNINLGYQKYQANVNQFGRSHAFGAAPAINQDNLKIKQETQKLKNTGKPIVNQANNRKPQDIAFQRPQAGKFPESNKQAKYVEKQAWNNQYQKPSSPRNSFDATFEANNQNELDIKNTFNPKIDIPINNNVGTNINLGYQKYQANVNQRFGGYLLKGSATNLDELQIKQASQKLKDARKLILDLPKPEGINIQTLGRRP